MYLHVSRKHPVVLCYRGKSLCLYRSQRTALSKKRSLCGKVTFNVVHNCTSSTRCTSLLFLYKSAYKQVKEKK